MTDRQDFSGVLTVHNGKGGSLKTSLTANLLALVAQTGDRVLGVDMDPQGNLAIGLGYKPHTDHGQVLADAINTQSPIHTEQVLTVRPNLDVIPGGRLLRGLNPPVAPVDALIAPLSELLDQYALIVIDTPPSGEVATMAALGASHHLLIPTPPDEMSFDGLELVVDRLDEVTPANPWLRILGVVLVQIPSAATAIRRDAQIKLTSMLGEDLLFTGTIRSALKSAVMANDAGITVVELAEREAGKKQWWRYLQEGTAIPQRADSAPGLATDYAAVATEALNRLNRIWQEEEQ